VIRVIGNRDQRCVSRTVTTNSDTSVDSLRHLRHLRRQPSTTSMITGTTYRAIVLHHCSLPFIPLFALLPICPPFPLVLSPSLVPSVDIVPRYSALLLSRYSTMFPLSRYVTVRYLTLFPHRIYRVDTCPVTLVRISRILSHQLLVI
jgi:hypothetical protein